MFIAENLGVRFGSRWIFRGLDARLEPGQVLAVRGDNGSGKSTFLRVAAGLLAASEGTLSTTGRAGYFAVDVATYPALTAEQHVAFVAECLGIAADPREVLESVGLRDTGNKLAGQFSTGMRVRLKLALASLGSPDWLILDEPTAALDESGRAMVHEWIRRCSSHGAVVMATNDSRDLALATHEVTFHA